MGIWFWFVDLPNHIAQYKIHLDQFVLPFLFCIHSYWFYHSRTHSMCKSGSRLVLIADHWSFCLFNQRAAVLSLSHTLLMYYDHNRCNKQNNGTSKSLVRRPIDILHLCSSNAVQYLRQTELFYSIWAHSFIAIGCRCATLLSIGFAILSRTLCSLARLLDPTVSCSIALYLYRRMNIINIYFIILIFMHFE